MLHVARLGRAACTLWSPQVRPLVRLWSSKEAEKQHDPLNILFCGADDFSISSLRALNGLRKDRPDKINNIEVLCRPDKRVGRGLKKIQEVPIKSTAHELGLTLHQIDTFTSWSPQSPINLVVAVSFGLLVPARLLTAAKYGGLNVHPSLLPDLRGPAPIAHTLLKRRSHTGVTVQSMHPTKFDHGMILAQTPLPGLPVPEKCSPGDLLSKLGTLGAEMLADSICDGLFVPPLVDVRQLSGSGSEGVVEHAPKITPEDRRIDWLTWTAGDIALRDRVLGRVWDTVTYAKCFPDRTRRVTYHGPWTIAQPGGSAFEPGEPVMLEGRTESESLLGIVTVDGKVAIPTSVTIEGEGKGKGLQALKTGLKNVKL